MCLSACDITPLSVTGETSTEMVSRERMWAGGARAGGREFTSWYF